jgi:type VI secretion system protein VasG
MATIPYYPLSDEMLGSILRLQLDRVASGRRAVRDPVHIRPGGRELIASRCTEVESGGRMIDAVLTNALLPQNEPGAAAAQPGRRGGEQGGGVRAGREFAFAFERRRAAGSIHGPRHWRQTSRSGGSLCGGRSME